MGSHIFKWQSVKSIIQLDGTNKRTSFSSNVLFSFTYTDSVHLSIIYKNVNYHNQISDEDHNKQFLITLNNYDL